MRAPAVFFNRADLAAWQAELAACPICSRLKAAFSTKPAAIIFAFPETLAESPTPKRFEYDEDDGISFRLAVSP
jgi:hypothetical protein